jgi:phage gp45-like
LQACSMRGEYDLYQPKYDAEGEHLEFKRHCWPNADCEADTIASPGTIGVDAPNISAANGVA